MPPSTSSAPCSRPAFGPCLRCQTWPISSNCVPRLVWIDVVYLVHLHNQLPEQTPDVTRLFIELVDVVDQVGSSLACTAQQKEAHRSRTLLLVVEASNRFCGVHDGFPPCTTFKRRRWMPFLIRLTPASRLALCLSQTSSSSGGSSSAL